MIDKDERQIELVFKDEKRSFMKGNKTVFNEAHIKFCNEFLKENLPKQELKNVRF